MQASLNPEPVFSLPCHTASQHERVSNSGSTPFQMTWPLQGLMLSSCSVITSQQPHRKGAYVHQKWAITEVHLQGAFAENAMCKMRLCPVGSVVHMRPLSQVQSPHLINSALWLGDTPQPKSSISEMHPEQTAEKCGWLGRTCL